MESRIELEMHPHCLFCGKKCGQRRPFDVAENLDGPNQLLSDWNEQCVVKVCRLLKIPRGHPVQQLLLADTTNYCANCEELIRDVEFTLSTIDKMQEKIIFLREKLDKNLDENWSTLGKTGQRRKMFGVDVRKLYTRVKRECHTWTRVDFLRTSEIENEEEGMDGDNGSSAVDAAEDLREPVDVSIKMESGDESDVLNEEYFPETPAPATPLQTDDVEVEDSHETQNDISVEGVPQLISTSSQELPSATEMDSCDTTTIPTKPKVTQLFMGKKARYKRCYQNLVRYQKARAAAKALELLANPVIPKPPRVKKPKRKVIRPPKPKVPKTTKNCCFCGLPFAFSEIEVHENLHRARQLPYSCLQCDENFAFPQHLTKHVRKAHPSVTETVYICIPCGKTTKSEAALRKHSLYHDPKFTKFTCQLCSKKYICRRDYDAHVALHNNIKNFMCELCGKAYGRQESLKTHMVAHHSENPQFACQVCGKAYSSKGGLRKHLPLHAGMSFQCPDCPKAFSTEAYLKQHSRYHLPKEQRKHYHGNHGVPQISSSVVSSGPSRDEQNLNIMGSSTSSSVGSSSSLPEQNSQ